MTIALDHQPTVSYLGSGTTNSNTAFSSAPTLGNLVIITVWASANVTITSDDGLAEIQTGYETFRRVSVFAKIAGGSEPLSYSFTLSGSSASWVFAEEWSTTDTWDGVTTGAKALDFDSTGANFEITSTPISTVAGSLLSASGFSGNTTTANQEINTGFTDFVQSPSTGTPRKAAAASKISSGGSQIAQFSLTDEATNNRLAVSLVEFKVTAPSTSITQTDDTPEDGAVQTINSTGLTAAYTAFSVGGKDYLSALSNTDPTTASTYTSNVFDGVAEATGPLIDKVTAVTISATATGGTATTNVTIQPPAGLDVTKLAGTLNLLDGGIKKAIEDNSAKTVVADNLIYFQTADNTAIAADGTITSDADSFEIQLGQGGSATTVTTWTPFTVTFVSVTAPVLASTKALSGIIDQSFSRTLTIQSGDPATSWLITGGADQAEYSLANSGVLTRDVPNPLEESEVITVTATNAGGTSNTQTVTITYGEAPETNRKLTYTKLTGVKLTATKLEASKL